MRAMARTRKPPRPPRLSLDEREEYLRDLLDPARGWVVHARDYRRVSDGDDNGEERSNEEQGDENAEVAERFGWELGAYYQDVGSASDFGLVERDGFDDLVDDLRNDRFNAHVLIVWTHSRGSRQVDEWSLLTKLCRERNVTIYVTSRRKLLDPHNPVDCHYLIKEANDAALYSAELSNAVSRAMKANAKRGKAHGPIAFGFQRTEIPDPQRPKRKIKQQEHDEAEAALIRELFDRLDGRGPYSRGMVETLTAIHRDWLERGVVNARGKPFDRGAVRRLAVSKAYAGLRVHEAGRAAGGNGDPTRQKIYKGNWEPIVPEDQFWRVYARVTDPSRLTHNAGGASHLLTRIAVCHECDTGLTPKAPNGRLTLRCSENYCVSVGEPGLNTVVVEAMFAWLSDPSVRERLLADYGQDERAVAARIRTTKIEEELRRLQAQVKAGRIPVDEYADMRPAIVERLNVARAEADRWSATSALGPLLGTDADLRDRWDLAELPTKRDILRTVLTPTLLGQVRVRAVGKAGGVPVADRIVWLVE